MKFMISPKDVKKEAEKKNVSEEELTVPPFVVLTFNEGIINELREASHLQKWEWPGAKFSPYASPSQSWKGTVDAKELFVVIPPMGASPVAAFTEEMMHFGAESIFLLCASWSLGEKYLRKGQIHLPTFAVGADGTSPHYGNEQHRVEMDEPMEHALEVALDTVGADWKKGGVGSCEAIYRITPNLVRTYRKKGCVSMENGEAATLLSIATIHDVPIGILFQPYIDLTRGWSLSFFGEKYQETCKLQARAALEVMKEEL